MAVDPNIPHDSVQSPRSQNNPTVTFHSGHFTKEASHSKKLRKFNRAMKFQKRALKNFEKLH